MSDLAIWTCVWCVKDFDDEGEWNEHMEACPDREPKPFPDQVKREPFPGESGSGHLYLQGGKPLGKQDETECGCPPEVDHAVPVRRWCMHGQFPSECDVCPPATEEFEPLGTTGRGKFGHPSKYPFTPEAGGEPDV